MKLKGFSVLSQDKQKQLYDNFLQTFKTQYQLQTEQETLLYRMSSNLKNEILEKLGLGNASQTEFELIQTMYSAIKSSQKLFKEDFYKQYEQNENGSQDRNVQELKYSQIQTIFKSS